MSDSPTTRRAPWPWLALGLATVLLFAAYPPFHFKRLGPDGKPVTTNATGAPAPFDAATFAATFWTTQLLPAAATAPELAPIALAVRADPLAAAQRHGLKVGEGTSWFYFARGSGTVVAVEKSRLLVEIDGAPGLAIALRTGPVFGNVARDATGLLELNSVPGLAEFNAVSAELNRLIEQSAQPPLQSILQPGARIAFAGCAPAPETVPDGPLLSLIPVQAELLP